MYDQRQEDESDCADIPAEAMQLGNHEYGADEDHVEAVDDGQPVKIMDRVEHQVRQRAPSGGEGAGIDAALAPDDLRGGRDDADRRQPLEPGGRLRSTLRRAADKIAKLGHASKTPSSSGAAPEPAEPRTMCAIGK